MKNTATLYPAISTTTDNSPTPKTETHHQLNVKLGSSIYSDRGIGLNDNTTAHLDEYKYMINTFRPRIKTLLFLQTTPFLEWELSELEFCFISMIVGGSYWRYKPAFVQVTAWWLTDDQQLPESTVHRDAWRRMASLRSNRVKLCWSETDGLHRFKIFLLYKFTNTFCYIRIITV